MKRVFYLILAALLLSAPAVQACTACFGQSDSRMAQGMNMGIFVLLAVIISVLGGVACFFVYLARRGAQAGTSAPQPPAADFHATSTQH